MMGRMASRNAKRIQPSQKAEGSRKRKKKQPTQHMPMETVMIVGPTGKIRFEKRPW